MAIRRFAQIAIGNLDLALGVVADLMIGQPERRIAAVLIRSAGLQDERTVRLSQAELGRLANVSRKLVNRALQRFAAASMVLPRYGAVQILDMQALKQFSAGARQ
jgi:CRP-like cAMP-binding protein